MQPIAISAALSVLLLAGTPALAQAPSWTVPPESQRCPSKWGAGDERGAGNHMKPQTVLNAVKLIKTGEVIELAHVLGPTMPFFGPRRFDMHLKRTFMNSAVEPARQQRGNGAVRDRPGRHPVRRLRPSDATATATTTASRPMRSRPAAASPSSASTMPAPSSRAAC